MTGPTDQGVLVRQLQDDRFVSGDLKLSARVNPQPGWLKCDGAAVSRTQYASLFNAIGTTYGAGDGSTTFNVPDLQGRVPLVAGTAVGAAGATAHTLGQKGGEETHTLTIAEMPSHQHGPDTVNGFSAFLGVKVGFGGTAGGNINDTMAKTAATGGGGSHNTLPPYTGVNCFIKA